MSPFLGLHAFVGSAAVQAGKIGEYPYFLKKEPVAAVQVVQGRCVVRNQVVEVCLLRRDDGQVVAGEDCTGDCECK